MRLPLGLALLAALSAPLRADDEALIALLTTAVAESAGGVDLELVTSAGASDPATRLARFASIAGRVGPDLRVRHRSFDLSADLAPEDARFLAGRGIAVRYRTRDVAGESYDWPYLDHLVLSCERGRGSIALPPEGDGDLVRLVARVGLGLRSRYALVAIGLEPNQVAAAVERLAGGGIDIVPIVPPATGEGRFDGLVVAAAAPLDEAALAFVRERLELGDAVLLALDAAAERPEAIVPLETGLEADLERIGLVLPRAILLDRAASGSIEVVVVGPDGRVAPRRLAAAHAFDGFRLAGPLRADEERLGAGGWRIVERLPAADSVAVQPLPGPASLARILAGQGDLAPAGDSTAAIRIAGAAGDVLVVRDADALSPGSALGPILARWAWDASRLVRTSRFRRPATAALGPGEVERIRLATGHASLELVREGEAWIVAIPTRPLLADERRIESLLTRVLGRARGEPAPGSVGIELSGCDRSLVAVSTAGASLDPAAWADLSPLPTSLETARSIRLPAAFLARIGSEWRVGASPGEIGDPVDPARIAALATDLSSAEAQIGIVESEPPEALDRLVLVEAGGAVRVLHLAGDVVYAPRGSRLVAYRISGAARSRLTAPPEAWRAGDGPRFVRLRQIVCPTEAEALAVLAEVRSGASFARLAAARARTPSAEDLGRIGRGDLHPALEEAAFGLAPGEVSGVVRTPFGFHLLERVD